MVHIRISPYYFLNIRCSSYLVSFYYFVFREENDVVPKVVEALLNLPSDTHIAVRYTSLLLLGELCEWMEKHPQSLGKYRFAV